MDERKIMNVSLHIAKTQLSKLLDLVENGQQVVIERHGRDLRFRAFAVAEPSLRSACRVRFIQRRTRLEAESLNTPKEGLLAPGRYRPAAQHRQRDEQNA